MQIDRLAIETPLGKMVARCDDIGITNLDFANSNTIFKSENKILLELERQLKEYFSKERKIFDLPLNPSGTPFQLEVWNTLLKIPYATTISYKKEAKMMGRDRGFRAVANANGKNPISIIIPCHRVIAFDGTLGGYSGGLDKKIALLELEGTLIHIKQKYGNKS